MRKLLSKKKTWLSILCLLVLTLALGGCGGKEGNAVQGGGGLSGLKLGMMPIADNLPFWVAEKNGYFKDEGIEVELIDFPSAIERDSALVAKQIDGGIGDLLAVAAMNNSGTGMRAVALAQGIQPGENRFAVLASASSGITSTEGLKNQPIAMSLNTINEYITDGLLLDKGLKQEEIKKLSIPKLPVRMEGLMNGTLKAATLPDPFATLAQLGGAHLIVDNKEKTVAQTVVMVRQETLDNNMAAVKKLMKAYSRAVDDIQKDSGQYNEMLVQKARVPQTLLEGKEKKLNFSFSQPQVPAGADVEMVVQWMSGHKLIKNNLTFEQMVDSRVLQ